MAEAMGLSSYREAIEAQGGFYLLDQFNMRDGHPRVRWPRCRGFDDFGAARGFGSAMQEEVGLAARWLDGLNSGFDKHGF